MGTRAEELATTFDAEMTRMIDFVSGLTEPELDAPCDDRQGHTVRDVLAHLREGSEQVVAWAAGVGTEPSGTPSARPRAGGRDPAGDSPAGEIEGTAAQLSACAAAVTGAVRDLPDRQLDGPAPAAEGITDGETPLHRVVSFIAEDVAAHRQHLVEAVGGRAGARPATTP